MTQRRCELYKHTKGGLNLCFSPTDYCCKNWNPNPAITTDNKNCWCPIKEKMQRPKDLPRAKWTPPPIPTKPAPKPKPVDPLPQTDQSLETYK